MPKPDREWFNSIKWSKTCIECRHQNGDTCPMRSCAETNYDENGCEIQIQYDGDYQPWNDGKEITNENLIEETWR